MAKKNYDWEGGAFLEKHTKKKHTILKQYFRQYLITRCQLPQQEKFRIAIVDGFAGAGLYKCGSYGSPLIFLDVLNNTLNEININRSDQGMRPIIFECLLILNDAEKKTIERLKENTEPMLGGIKEENTKLLIEVEYYNAKFDDIFPQIKSRLLLAKCSNVLFNLDQCGYSQVTTGIIREIMHSWRSAEIILTFAIKTILAYISPNEDKNGPPLEPQVQDQINDILQSEDGIISKANWLGNVEQVVFNYLKECAPYVSPFSINNPGGWQYWLMHFANSYRARQVYNDILHDNENAQAHFGRVGLKMLSYDPKREGQLYLFDSPSRKAGKNELYGDIPNLIAEAGDTLGVEEFYKTAYNETPAHSHDIHEMIIENPDVEVITEAGGERRKPNTIRATDILKLKNQKSMFSMFSTTKK